jgi:hypothetical protein
MKLHVLLIYLCAIVAGGILMVTMHRGTEVKLVAARELAENHLLQPGDLVLYTTGKQYVTRPLAKDAVIEAREIGTAPELLAKKGFTPFSLAVEPREILSRTIDAGQKLVVCPVKVQAEVRAVFCSGDATSCMVVLHVADGDMPTLKAAGPQLSLRKACG